MDAVCRAFADFYREHGDRLPSETQSGHYAERLRQSYPIHPEIFDRLYEDWSTLEKFQRTRGVLQYMAIVIHRLWNTDNRDALILPGSIPLDDSNVRNKSSHYLPQGWEPVIEKEIEGPRSEPFEIDGRDTRFRSVQAARRVARTIFLGSAPSTGAQMIRGIKVERILLGTVQPGHTIGVFEDVLKRLRDRLHYLYSDQDRFWYDTKPNLRRDMESRKQGISEQEQVRPLLKDQLGRLFGRHHGFVGIPVLTLSADVPDEYGTGPRLVVLPPAAAYTRSDTTMAYTAAEEVLRHRGDQPRQKQNRLIFLAPDYDVVSRLRDQARTTLAWRSIVNDIDEDKLNLDLFQAKQARSHAEASGQALHQLVREAYKWLICPVEEFIRGKPTLRWEAVAVSPSAPNLVKEIEDRLFEEEWLISEWSPIHLRNVLNQWYFKEGVTEVSALKVWQDSCHYLYPPRLLNDRVLADAISRGLESEDFFGFARGKAGERYLGFVFGEGATVSLDDSALLIEREAAAAYKERTRPSPGSGEDGTASVSTRSEVPGLPSSVGEAAPAPGTQPPTPSAKRRFYGTIDLDPVRAKLDFATIVDEVVQQFTSRLGIDISISVEIRATSGEGYDEALQRTIKENCNVLKFGSAEFEEGE
jgi:hypothetical protein